MDELFISGGEAEEFPEVVAVRNDVDVVGVEGGVEVEYCAEGRLQGDKRGPVGILVNVVGPRVGV